VTVPPWLVLSLVLSLTLALLYQIFSRRYGWRVLVYWVAVFAGFLGGELVAEQAGISLLRVGDLRLLPDFAGVFVVIGVLWFLGL
jgi:hypothetical protein